MPAQLLVDGIQLFTAISHESYGHSQVFSALAGACGNCMRRKRGMRLHDRNHKPLEVISIMANNLEGKYEWKFER